MDSRLRENDELGARRTKRGPVDPLGWGQAPALNFPLPTPGFRLSPECLCCVSRIFGWLGRGIVPWAGCSPPRRGTSPRATFPLPTRGLRPRIEVARLVGFHMEMNAVIAVDVTYAVRQCVDSRLRENDELGR